MSLNILMCCHLPLDPKLGGAKVYIESAMAYEQKGHSVTLLGLNDFDETLINKPLEERLKKLPKLLIEKLHSIGHKYDIVEYEYLYLPYEKPKNCKKTKFVARSVLLEYHLLDFALPKIPKGFFKQKLSNLKQNYLLKKRLLLAFQTLRNSDLINVPNSLDKLRLEREGFNSDKIIVSPYGTFREPLILNQKPSLNKIAYIASFDPRKGCLDLPKILSKLSSKTEVRLILLGTKGRFKNKNDIFSFFPKDIHTSLEVTMSFENENLDDLLKDIGIGIFPSYLESFGFGVIEMISRGIPVISYDVPGPSDILPRKCLVPPGDWNALVTKVLKLINEKNYTSVRQECLDKSKQFVWNTSVKNALEEYHKKDSSY